LPLSKIRLKLYRSLHHSKGRRQTDLFLIEGPDLIKEALKEGWPLKEALLTFAVGRNRQVGKELIKLLDLADVPHDFCSQSEMERISEAKTPQGAVALAQLPAAYSDIEKSGSAEVLLICECVSDPGNLGTLLRTADWFGVRKVFLGEGSADPFSPKAVRSSAGSIFRVNAEMAANISTKLARESKLGRKLFAAMASGKLLPGDLPRTGLRGLVVGHEKRGVSPEIASLCANSVRIGGLGRVESLNLAVATGILLHALCAA
jgi:TrmH family RNA methyltransferase